MSSNTLQNILIADIEPPLPPESQSHAFGISIGMTLIGLLVALVISRYRQTPRTVARRRLSQLKKNLHNKTVSQRQTSYQLPALLRQGLRLRKVDRQQPLPDALRAQQTRWQDYIAALDEARYARAEPSIDTLHQLADETHYWLNRWP